jgi:purine-nucleoside phosphorylase
MSYRYKTAVVAKIKKRNKPQVVNRDTEHIEQAARAIRRCWPLRPQVCLILGTGLGSLVDSIDTDLVLSYEGIPHFPCSTAPSHKGRLVCGRLAGVPVVTMDGRCHVYEGYRVDEITLPVRVARSLGATLLIVSNASGGLNPRFATGDLMVVADHVNLMGRRTGSYASAFAGHRRGVPFCPYDEDLTQRALEVARRENFVAHRGVYIAVSGPNYETRAEYRFLRRIGGDAVGMSTVPEVIAAAQSGMRVLAISTITNVATPDAPQKVQASDVTAAAQNVEPKLRKIVRDAVARGASL